MTKTTSKIRELAALPDGKKLLGIERQFEPIDEKWNVYQLDDGSMVRVRSTVVAIFQIVNADGVPLKDEDTGDPELFVSSQVTVVARGVQ